MQRITTGKITDDIDSWTDIENLQIILCPVCALNYNHIGDGITHTVAADPPGYNAGWSGRGELITIPMDCEEGHAWEVCLGFHKGQCFLFGRPRSAADTAVIAQTFAAAASVESEVGLHG
jgi:hypothetical protein